MSNTFDAHQGYRKILVAIDFSAYSRAALNQAVWLARQSGAQLVLTHTLTDLRRVVHGTSYQARIDLLYGEGDLFEHEVRRNADAKMAQMIEALNASDLNITCETLLGEPFVEITHAVQKEKFDLVLAGSRGLSAWEKFFLGSTAKRLIRKCPASVWIVKAEHMEAPRVVLATIDFSDVSLKAVRQGWWVAQQAQAEFHLLHVIDSTELPEEIIAKLPAGTSLRDEFNAEAKRRLQSCIDSLAIPSDRVHTHLACGTPWKDICRTAEHLNADLLVMGTVGRSGIQGLLLGNTAETVLSTCDCSILTVKPDNFVSPIDPATWALHPEPSDDQAKQQPPPKE